MGLGVTPDKRVNGTLLALSGVSGCPFGLLCDEGVGAIHKQSTAAATELLFYSSFSRAGITGVPCGTAKKKSEPSPSNQPVFASKTQKSL